MRGDIGTEGVTESSSSQRIQRDITLTGPHRSSAPNPSSLPTCRVAVPERISDRPQFEEPTVDTTSATPYDRTLYARAGGRAASNSS